MGEGRPEKGWFLSESTRQQREVNVTELASVDSFYVPLLRDRTVFPFCLTRAIIGGG